MATGLFNLKQVNQAISQGAWSGYIAPKWVEYLVVAGGGAGGSAVGGGGGAGGLLTGIVTVATGTSYTVTVGGGGSSSTTTNGGTGSNSVFGSIAASGGGGGASSYGTGNGTSGGSGGGASSYNGGAVYALGQGTANQGNAGGSVVISSGNSITGGGGGAGTVGLNGVNATSGSAASGGAGIASAISGTVTTYAGGGGGQSYVSAQYIYGVGGVGGGGAAGTAVGTNGTSGGGNTGGGGGATWGSGNPSGAGGSGIVVVRYPGSIQFFTGGTLSYANGYMIHTFYASGTLAPTTPTPYVTDYQISRSLRFNRADSAYLTRTPSSTGSRTTFTLSLWLKLGNFTTGNDSVIWASGDATSGDAPTLLWKTFDGTCSFVFNAGTSTDLKTTSVYRDPSAWYHVVLAVDTTQATASNRIKMYVNGVQVTAFSTATYPSQNLTYNVNTSSYPAYLGCLYAAGYIRFWEGYQTEVNFIDGQQLTPSSFGYTNPATGVWSPLAFVGTYGTNGFELNFSDNSNTTAATLGKDYSGNGNNWTPNNFSVTAGAGNDSLVDSPTSYGTDTGVGGTVRGNYATLNPLVVFGTSAFTNGNLDVSVSSANTNNFATIAIPTSGKWYWEYQITSVGGGAFPMAGIIATGSSALTSNVVYRTNGDKNIDGTGSSYGATYTTTDIIGVAVDVDGGTITFYKNGTSQGAITYATSSGNYSPALRSNAATDNFTFNFGQRAFANTAPSGYKALCTQNLPTPTIGATSTTLATSYFAPVLYTGNGSTQSVTVGFQPDLVWAKNRSSAGDNGLYDVLRGTTNRLVSNSSNAADTISGVTAFNSSGFTLGADYNASANTFVAWNWKANGSGSTNTAGSITSTVSANTTSGFSVLTCTTQSSGTGTVGHGLGVAPAMIIVKQRANTSDWNVYHTSIGAGGAIRLNQTSATNVSSVYWNDTAPTATVFTFGAGFAGSVSMVAYCFAAVAGYSAFGSYAGNGSSDGVFVYTGFRPAYIMVKRTDTNDQWSIYDSARNPSNLTNILLYANLTNADDVGAAGIDMLSNGIKVRATYSNLNASGGTYIFMAFASNPFKYSLAR